jgi:ankyrin repeat protein
MPLLEQNGYTALHRAANGGFADVVKALVASKANLTVLDKVSLLLPACFA